MAAKAGLVGVVTMACLTGVGGGVIRDVLAGEVPAVLREEVYASAAIAGAFVFWLLMCLGAGQPPALWAAASLTLLIRIASIAFRWRLPRRTVDENTP